jgi:hypothetical protein
VRIDQSDTGDTTPARADVPAPMQAADTSEPPRERRQPEPEPGDSASRTEHVLEHRSKVDGVYRAYAIDQGCARVEKIEATVVTPAMRRIEAEDPERHLAGLDHRLKGRDRLTEKVQSYLESNAELATNQAFTKVKDAIRYTFQYSDYHYSAGVLTDIERLKSQFEVVDVRNSWSDAEYKGVNSRWRVRENDQVFEVQFHTAASREAKETTHWAYERIRTPETSPQERNELQDYQRRVTAKIPIPPNVDEIENYP